MHTDCIVISSVLYVCGNVFKCVYVSMHVYTLLQCVCVCVCVQTSVCIPQKNTLVPSVSHPWGNKLALLLALFPLPSLFCALKVTHFHLPLLSFAPLLSCLPLHHSSLSLPPSLSSHITSPPTSPTCSFRLTLFKAKSFIYSSYLHAYFSNLVVYSMCYSCVSPDG